MTQALISPIELVVNNDNTTGYRVAQVEPDNSTFPVTDPMYWLSCDANVVADQYYFDTSSNTIKPKPVIANSNTQPKSTGTQTI